MPFDPRFLKGIELFNGGDFFEAHETWEDLWHATHDGSKDFVQGLIQVASSLHHMVQGNMRGARILHDSGRELLAPYGDAFMGVNLEKLLSEFRRALGVVAEAPLESLAGRGRPGPVKVAFTPSQAPRLEFKP